LVELQVKVAVAPPATAGGCAVNDTVGNGSSATAAVIGAVLPPGPVQTSTKVVLAVNGPVLMVPVGASGPLHPPEAAQEVALVEAHVSTDALPDATAVGDADNVAVGNGIKPTVAEAGAERPPGPEQTMA